MELTETLTKTIETKKLIEKPTSPKNSNDSTKTSKSQYNSINYLEETSSPPNDQIQTSCPKIVSKLTVDKYMLICKVSYFCQLAKDRSFQPYIIPFLTGIGLSPSEAGLINGIRLFGMIVGAPIWGYITDKKQNHRSIILLLIGFSLILIGGQPLVSNIIGDKQKNVCPSTEIRNTTAILLVDKKDNNKFRSTRFFIMLFLNVLGSFFDGPIMSMIDTGVVQRIKTASSVKNFGWNRMFGSFGAAFGSFTAGVISDNFPKSNVTCFAGAYTFYVAGTVLLAVCSRFLFVSVTAITPSSETDVEGDSVPEQSDIKKLIFRTLKDPEVVLFFLTVFFTGIAQSIFLSFISLRLQELDGSTLLIGLTLSIGSLSSLPTMTFSPFLISRFGGLWNTILISYFTFCIRFLGFAYMRNPWLAIPINLLNGFGFGLNITSFVLYVKTVSDPRIYTSMLSIMNVSFYGIAFIVANIAGGTIFEKYNGKTLFIVISGITAVWTFVLLMFSAVIFCRKKIAK